MSTLTELQQGLAAAAVPADVVESLLAELPSWWLQRERVHVLVSDLGLCSPPLREDEVRVLVWPSSDPAFCRISLAGRRERPLLLALAATVASQGLLVERAAAVLWRSGGVTFVRATLQDLVGQGISDSGWDRLAEDVKAAAVAPSPPRATHRPVGPVTVEGGPGLGADSAVVVTAPHRPGLLWAICSWLEAHGHRVESAQTESSGDVRRSIFVVEGHADPEALAAALRHAGSSRWPLRALASAAARVPLPDALRPRR